MARLHVIKLRTPVFKCTGPRMCVTSMFVSVIPVRKRGMVLKSIREGVKMHACVDINAYARAMKSTN